MTMKWNRFRYERSLFDRWQAAVGDVTTSCNTQKVLQACSEYPCVAARAVAFSLHSDNVKRRFSHHLDAFISSEASRGRSRLMLIAVVAAVLPLLGLLGTVTGMIQTFGAIGSGSGANPQLLAGGITQALLTTEAGLLTALPIVLGHAYLRGRMRKELETAAVAARHMRRLRDAEIREGADHV